MTGKKYLYRDKNVLFDSFDPRDNIVTFNLKNGHGFIKVEKEAEKADLFLDSLKEIKEEIIPEAEVVEETRTESSFIPQKFNYESPVLQENKKILKQLKDMLIEDMQKVRNDKSYIPQAKQACNTANSIIHLAKLEVVMSRTE